LLGIVPAFGSSGSGRCGAANPDDRSFRARSEIEAQVELPEVGGLHHRYERRAA